MICSIERCENKVHARGWCEKHYARWQRHGDPNFIKGHGYSNHPPYRVWDGMKERCYNKKNNRYKNYGARGITVCNEWMNPKAFIEWCLENGYKKGLQIDRRDNDGNYKSGNCRFVTCKENCDNRKLLQSNNTSGYRGVSRYKNKWYAYITINNKIKHLGCFESKIEAAYVYDSAVPDNRPRNFK